MEIINDDLKEKFGKKLREIRKEKGFTQEKIAEKTDMSVQSVSGFETGVTFPNYPNLYKLLKVLEVPAVKLFLYPEDVTQYKADEKLALLTDLLQGMPDEDVQSIINFARFLKHKKTGY